MKSDIEGYFIQLLFCKNRELLKQENRTIYDALYPKYREKFIDGQKQRMDVMTINNAFMDIFKGGKK